MDLVKCCENYLQIFMSFIFSVEYLSPYTTNLEEDSSPQPKRDTQAESSSWMRQMFLAQPLEIKGILVTHVARQTQRKEYLQYLIKSKNSPIEDSLWLDAGHIQCAGHSIKDLMDQRHEFSPHPGSLMREHPADRGHGWEFVSSNSLSFISFHFHLHFQGWLSQPLLVFLLTCSIYFLVLFKNFFYFTKQEKIVIQKPLNVATSSFANCSIFSTK